MQETNTIERNLNIENPTEKLLLTLEEFRKLDPIMHIHTVVLFLRVAEAAERGEWVHMKELEKRIGIASSSLSRQVSVLGDGGTEYSKAKGQKGLDLVTTATAFDDPRALVVTLTPRGRRVYDGIKRLFSE